MNRAVLAVGGGIYPPGQRVLRKHPTSTLPRKRARTCVITTNSI
jgi:hypothetical protein